MNGILERPPEYQANHLPRARLYALPAVLGLVLLLFTVRLFRLQVLEYAQWEAQAEENRVEVLNIPAPRGAIYDRNGVVLARNVAAYHVVVTPAYLPDDPGTVERIFQELSRLLDMPLDYSEISPENPYVPCRSDHGIRQIVYYGETTAPYRAVRLKCNVPREVAMMVEERNWPGIGVEVEPIRDYPTGEPSAVVVGFLGPVPEALVDFYEAKGLDINRDKVGYAGIEMYYQDLLAGRNGRRVVEVDVAGRILRDLEPPQKPVPGTNIRLTIDWDLQRAAYHIVRQELDEWNAYFNGTKVFKNAVAIAMNPKTGEILAMVSVPTFDNQMLTPFIPQDYYEYLVSDEFKPLLNHAISAEHPPGSVFKLMTATAALNEGVVRPNQVIDTPGTITLIEKFFARQAGRPQTFYDWNWETGGFGQLEFLDCIAWSSNVCFYKVGGGYFDEIPDGGVGICRIGVYAKAMGYGQRTGIDLPGEADGLIPDPRWKRIYLSENWSTGDTYLASVGQGYVLATPLQMLVAAATIANGGKVVKPTLLYQVLDAEGRVVRPFQPTIIRDVTKEPVIDVFENPGGIGSCRPTGEKRTIDPKALALVREGMRRAVLYGTLERPFRNFPVSAAGKTGSAEYCDNRARAAGRCIRGSWPSHAWTVAFAPFEDPEIAVVAFVYDGTEGATVAAPIVRSIMEYYFNHKAQVERTGPLP